MKIFIIHIYFYLSIIGQDPHYQLFIYSTYRGRQENLSIRTTTNVVGCVERSQSREQGDNKFHLCTNAEKKPAFVPTTILKLLGKQMQTMRVHRISRFIILWCFTTLANHVN